MIDELEMLKSIISELTSIGIWAVIAYIGYSLAKIIFTLWAILWAVLKVFDKIMDVVKAPISKAEADNIIKRNDELEREIQSVKHKYAIMKEKACQPSQQE